MAMNMKPYIKNIILLSAVILSAMSCKTEGEKECAEIIEPVACRAECAGTEDNASGIVPLLDIMIDHLDGHDRLQTACLRLRNHYSNCRIDKE